MKLSRGSKAWSLVAISLLGAVFSCGLFAESAFASPPANDAFGSAQSVGPALPVSVNGTTAGATGQSGEPDHQGYGDGPGQSVWYSWTPASSLSTVFDVCSGDYPTIVVYTGGTVSGLTQVGTRRSSCNVTLAANAGTTYRVAVTEGYDASFVFKLRQLFPPANDNFANAQEIGPSLPISVSGSTTDASPQPGEPDHGGNGYGAEQSVWYRWTPSSDVAVKFDAEVCPSVYTGTVLNSLTRVNSEYGCGGSLSVPAGTTLSIAVDSCCDDSFTLKISAVSGRPPNDDFQSAEMLGPNLPVSVSGTTTNATPQLLEPGDYPSDTVWYSWTPSANTAALIDACEGLHPGYASVAVFTGSSLGSLTPVAEGDSECKFSFSASAGIPYKIKIQNSRGPFDLQVRVPNPPANDNFADAQSLGSGAPKGITGTTSDATAQTGEPDHQGWGYGARQSVWYSWTATSTSTVKVSLCENELGYNDLPEIAVYKGSSVGALTHVTNADGDCQASFPAVAGTSYKIAVDASRDVTFSLQLRSPMPPANDNFSDSQTIISPLPQKVSGTTADATPQAGEPDHEGDGNGPQQSVWYSWTPSASQTVKVSACRAYQYSYVAVYTGSSVGSLTRAVNSDGSCSLRFAAAAGTTYRIAVGSQSDGTFRLVVNLPAAPANDNYANAQDVGSVPVAFAGTNEEATSQAYDPVVVGSDSGEPGHTVWYRFTPSESATYDVNACEGDHRFVGIGVFTDPGGGLGSLARLTPDYDTCKGSINAVSGQEYKILVTAFQGDNNFTLRINKSGQVTQHNLSVSRSGDGSGTVTSAPSGIDCGTNCAQAFDDGTQVTLSAASSPGSTFTGWSGAGCSGTGICKVTIAEDAAVVATFSSTPAPVTHTLTVTRSGTGQGTVNSDPEGIDCGSTCSFDFVEGAAVTLTASATTGSSFAGWSGGGCSGTGTCQVAVGANTQVSAAFIADPAQPARKQLTVTKVGTGAGSVSSSPSGIDCGTTCSASFDESTTVRLSASPAAGSTFTGWSGACSGTSETCDVTLGEDKNATANFEAKTNPTSPPTPRVTVNRKPAKKTKSRSATFTFRSSVAGSAFSCKLDRKAFSPCRSPKTYKKLKAGKHTFKVKATASGKTSPTVSIAWKINK